jgi:lipoate-protein ligase A
MLVLELTLADLKANLALDEALLLAAEAGEGGEVLRFWEWPRPAVILGAGCRLKHDVHEEACLRDGVPVLRRASGGGTVLLGEGCLCYSLVLSTERAPGLRGVRLSYRSILEQVRLGLSGLASDIHLAGISDLAIEGRKISGNAQQRKRNSLLHHGTILYDFDSELVGQYLRMPARRPEYRQERAHGDFLTNLHADPEDLKKRLRLAWRADAGPFDWPRERVRRLVEEKYSRLEWTYRFK